MAHVMTASCMRNMHSRHILERSEEIEGISLVWVE